jgi:hypothetical protein
MFQARTLLIVERFPTMSSNVATFAQLSAFADSNNIDIDTLDPITGMDDLRAMYAASLPEGAAGSTATTPKKDRENQEYTILLVNKVDGTFTVHGSAMSGAAGGLNDMRESALFKISRAANKGVALLPIEIPSAEWETGSKIERAKKSAKSA